MIDLSRPKYFKNPTFFEWVSMTFAIIAIVVSIMSYAVSGNTEEALQEDLQLECSNDKAIVDVSDHKKPTLYTTWILRIYNNSRSPVNIINVSHDVDVIGGTVTNEPLNDILRPEKNMSDHTEIDRAYSLEAAKATTVWFSEYMPISTTIVDVPGIAKIQSVDQANDILAVSSGVDLFGRPFVNGDNGIRHYKDVAGAFDWVNARVTTSRGQVYNEKCVPYQGFQTDIKPK